LDLEDEMGWSQEVMLFIGVTYTHMVETLSNEAVFANEVNTAREEVSAGVVASDNGAIVIEDSVVRARRPVAKD
jgi:hypothetical protein